MSRLLTDCVYHEMQLPQKLAAAKPSIFWASVVLRTVPRVLGPHDSYQIERTDQTSIDLALTELPSASRRRILPSIPLG